MFRGKCQASVPIPTQYAPQGYIPQFRQRRNEPLIGDLAGADQT